MPYRNPAPLQVEEHKLHGRASGVLPTVFVVVCPVGGTQGVYDDEDEAQEAASAVCLCSDRGIVMTS